MKYKLKKNVENFDVVDGPFAGREYRRGKVYDEKDIPPGEKRKFEPVPEPKADLPARSAQAGSSKSGAKKEDKKARGQGREES